MAITKTKNPLLVSLSGDPILYGFTTDKYLTNAGTKAVFTIALMTLPTNGDTQVFTWNGNTYTFTVATTADDSGNQMTNAGTLIQWRKNFRDAFNTNFDMSAAFIAAVVGTDVVITARDYGDDFNLSFTNDTSDASTQTTSGVDRAFNPNYGMGVEVWVEDEKWSENFVPVATKIGVPNEDQEIIVDIREIVAPYVNKSIDYFGVYDGVINLAPNICKRFYIRYYEQYGSSPDEKIVTTETDIYFVLKGARRHAEHFMAADSFYNMVSIKQQWLTWKKSREVTVNEPQMLTWFNYNERAEPSPGVFERYRYRMNLYFSDGTSQLNVVAITDDDSQKGDVLVFPAGFTELGIADVDPSKTVVRYELYLYGETTGVLTETISFKVVDDVYHERYVLFENSMGAFETQRTTGVHEFSAEVTQDTVRIAYDVSKFETTNKIEPTYFQKNSYYKEVNVGRTGPIGSRRNMLQLVELMNSRSRFMYDPLEEVIKHYPIIFTSSNTYPINTDASYLMGLEFEYAGAFDNSGYSKISS